MLYAAFRHPVESGFFRDGMPVGVRSVADRVAFSVPLHCI